MVVVIVKPGCLGIGLAVQTWGAFFDPMMPGGGSSLVVAVIEVVRTYVGLRV